MAPLNSSKLSQAIKQNDIIKGANEEGFDLSFDIKKNQILFLTDLDDEDEDDFDGGTADGTAGKIKNDDEDQEYNKLIGRAAMKLMNTNVVKRTLKDK